MSKENNTEITSSNLIENIDEFSFENLQLLLEEQLEILQENFNITESELDDKLTEMSEVIYLERLQADNKNFTTIQTIPRNISKEQTISLCKIFLAETNSSWLTLFNKLVDSNSIIENRKDPRIKKAIRPQNTWQSIKENNENYIFALWQENITDPISLIHEFSHYITSVNNNDREDYHEFEEFPSIFFEKQMKNFLEKIGYSKDLTNTWELYREDSIIENANNCFSYIYLLKTLIHNKKLTIDDKLLWINMIEESKKQIDPDYDIEKDYQTSKENLAWEEGYDEFENLRTNELEIIESYSYIIGAYYATKLEERVTMDNDIIPKMIKITEQLPDLSSQQILQDLNLKHPKILTKS